MIHERHSSRRTPKSKLIQAQELQREINELGDKLKTWDGSPGVDQNSKRGIVEFKNQAIQSESFEGVFSGSVSYSKDELKFSLWDKEKRPVAQMRRTSHRNDVMLYGKDGLTRSQVQDDGVLPFFFSEEKMVDPSSRDYKVGRWLSNLTEVAKESAIAAFPVSGFCATALNNFFNDSDPGYGAASILANMAGSALVVGGLIASAPAVIGVGAGALAISGLIVGAHTSKHQPSAHQEPFVQETAYEYQRDGKTYQEVTEGGP